MTLFGQVSEPDSVFATALARYFSGQPDQRTLDLLKLAEAAGRRRDKQP